MGKDELVANVLYRNALDEERIWRSNPNNRHDVLLFDEMLSEINMNGYNYKYYPDISMRKHEDKVIVDIIANYIGQYFDEGITGELVRSIGTKNGKIATERIIKSFFNLSEKSKHNHALFYNEALGKINDKRYISEYLLMIKSPEYAQWFGSVMNMLGKWKNDSAKLIFLDYLNSNNVDLIVTAAQALRYYKNDPDVIQALQDCLKRNSSSAPISKHVGRVLEKIV